MIDRSQVREGMTVFSSDGEKLGKVQRCDASSFIIEKGFFFPKDYVARFDDVADVAGDDVRLSMTKDQFTAIRDRGDAWADETGATSSRSTRVSGEDERDAGQVRLRKDVVTETRHVDVPVTRERSRTRVVRTPFAGMRSWTRRAGRWASRVPARRPSAGPSRPTTISTESSRIAVERNLGASSRRTEEASLCPRAPTPPAE